MTKYGILIPELQQYYILYFNCKRTLNGTLAASGPRAVPPPLICSSVSAPVPQGWYPAGYVRAGTSYVYVVLPYKSVRTKAHVRTSRAIIAPSP